MRRAERPAMIMRPPSVNASNPAVNELDADEICSCGGHGECTSHQGAETIWYATTSACEDFVVNSGFLADPNANAPK